MGIPGLLRMLKPYTQPVHVKKYSGKRVGIDAYCWLHKGAYACSFGVCEGDCKIASMEPCIKYCMHYINLLRFNNVIPVVVFDGGRLPSKAFTENERQRRRDLNLEQARLKLSEGDINGAQELCQRAVEITPPMAQEFVKVLKAAGVEFVVAPYEADAQLAYLSSLCPEKGGVVAVISEDSDLLAYGCSVVMYKMDRYGNGEEVRLKDILKKRTTMEGPSNTLWFGCFTQELFTGMCVLAGCDFLPSVPGIGIKRAHCLVCKYRDLARVLSSMRFDRKLVVPDGYELAFKQANAIFHHATVYDASARKLSFLKPLPAPFVDDFNGDLHFLGPDLPPSRALAIAEGRLDPISMCAFNDFTCNKPDLPQDPLKVVKMTHIEPRSHLSSCKLMQGDVWLGTDDELLTLFAADGLEPSLGPLPPTRAPVHVQPDNGFLAQLSSMANSKAVVPHLDNRLSASNNPIVTLSPGKKRVLPPPPDNNPFKRGKPSDPSSILPSRARFLFDTQLDEKIFCREVDCLEKATWLPHQASDEAVTPFSQEKGETCRPSAGGDSVDDNVTSSSISMKAVHCQGTVPAKSRTVAALHVQDLENKNNIDVTGEGEQSLEDLGEAGDSEVSKQWKRKITASLQGDGLDIKSVQEGYTRQSEVFKHPALRASMSAGHQDTGVLQNSTYGDSLMTGQSMSSSLHRLKVGTESPKTPTITKQMHRESKAKKDIRSSSKQSSKVVMVASTPSLLKFFQRAPTL